MNDAEWINFGFTVVVALLSGVAGGSFFVASIKRDVETLKSDRTEVKRMIEKLREELDRAAKIEDVHRIEQHLRFQDQQLADRFKQITDYIFFGRKPSGV